MKNLVFICIFVFSSFSWGLGMKGLIIDLGVGCLSSGKWQTLPWCKIEISSLITLFPYLNSLIPHL